MNSNEDKLRRVLFEESATVVPSADAWPKIREGVDRRRRWRQWLQYGGATAGATAAIVAGVVLANSEGLGQRDIADDPTLSVSATPDPTPTTEPSPRVDLTTPAPTRSPTPSPILTTPSSVPTPTARVSPTPSAAQSADPRPSADESPGGSDVATGRLRDAFAAAVSPGGEGTPARLALLSKSDGRLVRSLTRPAANGHNPQPEASPDGKYIYFVEPGDNCSAAISRVRTSGGDVETVVDGRESIFAFALNGEGTRIAALRTAECGGPESTPILVEYDAISGKELRQLDLPDVAGVLTDLAWHPALDELAIVWAGQDGKPGVVVTYDANTEKVIDTVGGLPGCINDGIKHIAYSASYLYIGRECMDPETAAKTGHIYQVALGGDTTVAKIIATSPAGTSVTGLHVDLIGERVVYSIARWMEEGYGGPGQVFALRPGAQPTRLLTIPSSVTNGLAW